MTEQESGWNEWSRHVLKELERLNDNYESLRAVNEDIKTEMTRISSMKVEVDDLKEWRSRIDDVCSPAQLRDLIQEIESLRDFKSKAVAIFATVQFGMVALAWALNVFN
tara:strand:+ start:5135 stop:5461 length:327 start_codon:yes stop_codon:yes gene_type:complete